MVQWWRIRDLRQGPARPGAARQGRAWRGHQWCRWRIRDLRLGKARPGAARQGEGTNGAMVAYPRFAARQGQAGRGRAGLGVAGRGMARQGMGTNGAFSIYKVQCERRTKMTERKQFEEDPEIAARVELLRLGTSDYSRGHVLMWEVAEGLLGLDRNDEKMKYAVLKWRKYVHRELRIETWAIPGTGVKLLTESEQIEMLPQKRARRAYRQHGLILRSLRNTNLANLTDHQRRIAAAVNEHSRAARTATNKVTNTTRGKIPNDRQALIDRARRIAEEIKIR